MEGSEGLVGDPLLSLGLVDPRGNAVPTADWSGPDSNTPGENNGSNTDSRTNPASQPAGSGQAQINWDDSANPYKPNAVTQSQQTYQARVAQLQAEVPVAIQVLTSQGYHPTVAQQMVESLFAAGAANARTQADRIAMLPLAKQAAAEQISKEQSTSRVSIDPKELVNETTVEAMQAKARTIVAERRDNVVSQRAANGADRVERTGASASVDYSQLSPHSMISLGLRRGQ